MNPNQSRITTGDGPFKSFTSRSRWGFLPAFTLIELLVVLGVIATLISLLLPVVSRTQQRAQQTKCAHNEHQLGLGLAQFITDYQVYPSDPILKQAQWTSWFEALEAEGLSASKNSRFYEAGVWYCPSAPRPSGFPAQWFHGSYGYN